MSIIGYEIKKRTELPIGIQILAGANIASMAAAHAAGLDFIRAEGFVFGHLADEGFMQSDAGYLLRYRKKIGADDILVLTDIKKKHSSHSITNDISIEQTAEAAEFFMSDGIVITGASTGSQADLEEIKSVRKMTKLPIIVGSGININNIDDYYKYCDSFIVGSYFKRKGSWKYGVDKTKVKNFMNMIRNLRKN